MSDQPDFDHLDTDYDRFLPLLQGADDGLLAALKAVPESGRVLDLACGVGEPAVTLARQRPDLRLTGIDISETQIAAARARATQLGIDGVRFEVMSMDALELGTGSVDAVMSRMGALMMGDPARTAREAARVLTPGGRLAVAVWGTLDMHAAMRLGLRCLESVLPAEEVPDFSAFDRLAAAGVRDGVLREAGLTAVESHTLRWTFERADFESWWSLVLSIPGPMQDAFRRLDQDALSRARRTMAELAAPCRRRDGSYAFPMGCQLLSGRV
ncbi:class I SAM-dependent methyltransferase [Streptomyces sp. NPDC088194]|uniref:class I SAM-dependent methyltransferase n=1 Tax=Streptomyces sp. NPDC088194 TaxID=3154931 RepID=UPI00344FE20C